MTTEENFIAFAVQQFQSYKSLAEKAFVQVPDEKLFWQPNEDSNSIAMIIQHMAGNMLSRWTDFMTSDGDKDWRNRDEEFEVVQHHKVDVYLLWERGWQCLFDALEGLSPAELHHKVLYQEGGAYRVGSHQQANCSLLLSCRADRFYRENLERWGVEKSFHSKAEEGKLIKS